MCFQNAEAFTKCYASFLDVGSLFMAAPAKHSRCSLPWRRGISSPPPFRGIAPLGPPVPTQPRLLGCGVCPPSHHPWPRAWGVGYLLLAAAPDLGRGVSRKCLFTCLMIYGSWISYSSISHRSSQSFVFFLLFSLRSLIYMELFCVWCEVGT